MDDPENRLRLLQLTDSGFPTGAFAFSHGLEGLVAAGNVRSESDVAEFIAIQLREGFTGIECPAMSHAWRAARNGDLLALMQLDALLDALKAVPVFRNGSVRTGRRLLESATGILAGASLDALRTRVQTGETSGHHSMVFGVVMEAAALNEVVASLALGAGFVGGLAAAAVRLGIIGQGAAQRMVTDLHVRVAAAAARGRTIPIADMGAYLPMIDIAGLRQPALRGRVFAS
jgi:urease accessory protein